MTKEQIVAEAIALDPHERGEVADAIWTSLTPSERAEIDAAWLAESHRRNEANQRGEVGASPVDEVIDRVRSRASR